jgi:hypothetical protein
MSRCTGMVPIAAVLVAGVVFGFGALRAEQAPTESSALTSLGGRWKLNLEKSDDARKAMREAEEGRRGDRPGGRGGPPGGPGGGMGGAGGRGPGGRPGVSGGGDSREEMRAVFEAPSEMLITPTANEIVILETDGRLRTLHPDGKGYKSEGGANETKTRWEGARLVVETRAGSGLKMVETFALAAPAAEAVATGADGANPISSGAPRSPRTMTVTLRMEGMRRPPLTLTRVYEQAPSSE